MYWDITDVKVTADYTLWVRFRDGTEGWVEFKPDFFKGVFLPLQQKDLFEKVLLNDGVITWEGELDLAPDALYSQIKAHKKAVLPH